MNNSLSTKKVSDNNQTNTLIHTHLSVFWLRPPGGGVAAEGGTGFDAD